jgi:hypothetical protein
VSHSPRLTGTGRVEAPLRVDFGGAVPSGRLQWCRDGVPIPEAEGAEYTPHSIDDRAEIVCRITQGGRICETPPLRITRDPPEVAVAISDEIFDLWGGEEVLPVGQAFSGEDLHFAVMGARARVDPLTGELAIPTDLPLSGEPVRVTAQNSGGSATLEFLVTVEAEGFAAPSTVRTIFVDYERGSDANPGTSESTPRKTVPSRPAPGTVIYLRRGSVYRDSINLIAGGLSGAPVVLDGQSWGSPEAHKARIDLSVPLIGWSPGPVLNGAHTWQAPVPEELRGEGSLFGYVLLFQGDRQLYWAQDPAPQDPDYPSQVYTEFHTFEGLREADGNIYIRAPSVFRTLSVPPVGFHVRVWVEGNAVAVREVLTYDHLTGEIGIPRGRGRSNPSMRIPCFALYNHPDALTSPGRFYHDSRSDRIIVRPYDDLPPEIAGIRHAAGGSGIRFSAPHTEIRGFEVIGCMDRRPRSGCIYGLMSQTHANAQGVVIADNDVRHSCLGGSGIVLTHAATGGRVVDARVERNTAFNLPTGGCRGLWASRLQGGLLRANRAGRCGSTSISLYNSAGTRVYGNTAERPSGIHGNGFSFYEGCRDLVVMFNTVFLPLASGMAMTAQSSGRCVFACNTLVMLDQNAAAHYGPRSRYPEEGGHIWANNIVQTSTDNRAFQMQTRPPPARDGVAPIVGTVLVNNICHGINPTAVAGPGSFAKRTRNVLTVRRQSQLTPAQMAMIGELLITDRDYLFVDWTSGDFRPTAQAWREHLVRGEPVTIRGVVLDWIGRYRVDGSEAWNWRLEPL